MPSVDRANRVKSSTPKEDTRIFPEMLKQSAKTVEMHRKFKNTYLKLRGSLTNANICKTPKVANWVVYSTETSNNSTKNDWKI